MPIEYAIKKELTETQKNRIKRFERALKEGKIGRFISWFDFMNSKKKLSAKDFQYYKFPFGRIGNNVYTEGIGENIYLYRKFKNATKAKKFLSNI